MAKFLPKCILLCALAGVGLTMLSTPAWSERVSRTGPVALWQHVEPDGLKLKSYAALVVDQFGNELFAKHSREVVPIASITKLMTAMVVLDSQLPLDEPLSVSKQDYDRLRSTGSRLKAGAVLTRGELLTLTLMASENRAAFALSRHFPGGRKEFIRRMNAKAATLGLYDTKFGDPTGLDPLNVSTATDLGRMVRAAQRYPEIQQATTRTSAKVRPYAGKAPLKYVNTNRLVNNEIWSIELSKTGYVNEAGRCLVMMADVKGEPIVVVLLNSYGKLTPISDANRVRKWIERGVNKAAASKLASRKRPANS